MIEAIIPAAAPKGCAPLYQDRAVRLYLGDCLAWLPTIASGTVDLVLTDPPYNLSDEENQGMARKVRPNSPIAGDKGAWDRLDPEAFEALIRGFLLEAFRVLRPGGLVGVFFSHHEEDNFKAWIKRPSADPENPAAFEILNRIIWHKTNPPPLFVKTRCVWSYEQMIVAKKAGGRNTCNFDAYPYREMHDVWDGPICMGQSKERRREEVIGDDGLPHLVSVHPTQKPLWLMEKALRIFSNPGDLVVDPFAGMATTAAAAITTGRRCLTIDRSPKYAHESAARLAEVRAAADASCHPTLALFA